MSSETSTSPQTLPAWQLFALAGLVGATIVVFVSRGQPIEAVLLLSLTVFAAAAVGAAALRTLLPFVSVARFTASPLASGRTRAALEREKTLVLRSIKELEFDHAMGKVSDQDFSEMGARLRVRAARLLQQLDAGTGYRTQIERELTARLGARGVAPEPAAGAETQPEARTGAAAAAACQQCGTRNDADARFCKSCGERIAAA